MCCHSKYIVYYQLNVSLCMLIIYSKNTLLFAFLNLLHILMHIFIIILIIVKIPSGQVNFKFLADIQATINVWLRYFDKRQELNTIYMVI